MCTCYPKPSKKSSCTSQCSSAWRENGTKRLLEQHIANNVVENERWNNEMVNLLKDQIRFLKAELVTKNTIIDNLMKELDLRPNSESDDRSFPFGSESSRNGVESHAGSSGYNSSRSLNRIRSRSRSLPPGMERDVESVRDSCTEDGPNERRSKSRPCSSSYDVDDVALITYV